MTTLHAAPAGPSLLRPLDVVALVGGEDMVAAFECGYLEYFIVREKPAEQLKFRSVTKEGDTAFEQARDFNYPNLERQLTAMGATVVVIQVGQMESLRGTAGLPEFEQALEKLIAPLADGGKRRVILVGPTPVSPDPLITKRFAALPEYRAAIQRLAQRQEVPFVVTGEGQPFTVDDYRDGVHLNERGHLKLARQMAAVLGGVKPKADLKSAEERRLIALIQEKNQLWFHYVRPQNWAFLDGDRTVQPASRDHRNPELRWFPEEMKTWLPLVAKSENEIWALARQLHSK